MQLFLFFALILFPPSFATSMYYIDDVQQAQLSDAVVIAKIGSAQTKPHPQYKSLMTETEIMVEEIIIGNAPKFLKIRQMGGTMNGKTMVVPGDAKLEAGSKVVLFLNEQDGTWYLTALEQSKYNLEQHHRLGWIMKRALHEGILTRDTNGALIPFKPVQPKPFLTLNEFRTQFVKGEKQ
jgi:hypothetical protein